MAVTIPSYEYYNDPPKALTGEEFQAALSNLNSPEARRDTRSGGYEALYYGPEIQRYVVVAQQVINAGAIIKSSKSQEEFVANLHKNGVYLPGGDIARISSQYKAIKAAFPDDKPINFKELSPEQQAYIKDIAIHARNLKAQPESFQTAEPQIDALIDPAKPTPHETITPAIRNQFAEYAGNLINDEKNLSRAVSTPIGRISVGIGAPIPVDDKKNPLAGEALKTWQAGRRLAHIGADSAADAEPALASAKDWTNPFPDKKETPGIKAGEHVNQDAAHAQSVARMYLAAEKINDAGGFTEGQYKQAIRLGQESAYYALGKAHEQMSKLNDPKSKEIAEQMLVEQNTLHTFLEKEKPLGTRKDAEIGLAKLTNEGLGTLVQKKAISQDQANEMTSYVKTYAGQNVDPEYQKEFNDALNPDGKIEKRQGIAPTIPAADVNGPKSHAPTAPASKPGQFSPADAAKIQTALEAEARLFRRSMRDLSDGDRKNDEKAVQDGLNDDSFKLGKRKISTQRGKDIESAVSPKLDEIVGKDGKLKIDLGEALDKMDGARDEFKKQVECDEPKAPAAAQPKAKAGTKRDR